MLFSSITFLYFFLPCVLLFYFIAPKQGKNLVLLFASFVFYAWGEPKYVFLMLAEIIVGYLFGLGIGKLRHTVAGKILLVASLLWNLGLLGYFKYADFFVDNINCLTGAGYKLLGIALPIGISFYTFQILSYTIDVYRGDVAPQKNLLILATYVAMFPQLIAGPIVRYSDVEQQLRERKHDIDKIASGIRRFVIGLAKKIFIANALGELCNVFREASEPSVSFYWLYAVAFTLHIYFDFSGYSDMAIGLGKIFGFDFLENFNYPYISKSISEFWRRWHMSLGQWFRDYVYIPLGGNRVNPFRWMLNVWIVWFLTGFWHGAAWNFIAWGLFYGMLLMIEKLFLGKYLKKTKVVNYIYTMFFVIIGFVIFNANDMAQASSDLACIFGMGGLPFYSAQMGYFIRSYAVVLILAIVGATPFPKEIVTKLRANQTIGKMLSVAEVMVLPVLVILMTAYLVDGSFNPFLYFRF
jgi:alginate O-acetyltransferase complex protein AlgI